MYHKDVYFELLSYIWSAKIDACQMSQRLELIQDQEKWQRGQQSAEAAENSQRKEHGCKQSIIAIRKQNGFRNYIKLKNRIDTRTKCWRGMSIIIIWITHVVNWVKKTKVDASMNKWMQVLGKTLNDIKQLTKKIYLK